MAKQELIQEAIKVAKEVGYYGQPTVNAFNAYLRYMEHCKDKHMENYEDKYKKAFKRAKENYHAGCLAPALLEYIFPELKEYDDDHIMYVLQNIVTGACSKYGIHWDGVEKSEDLLAWLETHKYTEKDLDEAYKCADKVQYMNGYNDAKEELEKQDKERSSWNEKTIADIFEKVGLAKIVREEGSDRLTNAVQMAMIELAKQVNSESEESEDSNMV